MRHLLLATAALFMVGCSQTSLPKREHFIVENLVVQLANSPTSGYVTADFDVRAERGSSLIGLAADLFLMGPDRTLRGQGGSTAPTASANKLHFHLGPTLFDQTQCPPKLLPQQLVVLSRNAVIIEGVPADAKVIPSSQPGGCH